MSGERAVRDRCPWLLGDRKMPAGTPALLNTQPARIPRYNILEKLIPVSERELNG